MMKLAERNAQSQRQSNGAFLFASSDDTTRKKTTLSVIRSSRIQNLSPMRLILVIYRRLAVVYLAFAVHTSALLAMCIYAPFAQVHEP